jgi:serine/threonine-protein kinase
MDRYLLTDRIGSGGMGTVWRAWDTREGRWVAMKLLARYDAASLQRFAREQELRVRHRHVLAPLDIVEGGFTTDLVRGGSVQHLLDRHGPLPDAFVRVVLEQTLEALVAVHARGVVHRDLKPGNLLLEPTGTGRPWVRVSDFGVAAVGEERLTRVPGGVGTGGYMPPEQADGAEPDARQDLYAVGVVARRLLTGSTTGEVGGSLGALVGQLTEDDARRRPRSAAAALEVLRTLPVPRHEPWPAIEDVLGHAPPPGPTRWTAYVVPAVGCFAAASAVGMLLAWLVR